MQENELPKTIKKALRSLVRIAYDAELSRSLESLSRDFDQWKAGEINSFELADRIHAFHNGPNRDAYVRYTSRVDPRLLVRYALEEGLIKRELIQEEVWQYID
jgi:hypothetical protein